MLIFIKKNLCLRWRWKNKIPKQSSFHRWMINCFNFHLDTSKHWVSQTIGIILWEIDRQLFGFSMTVFLFSFNHNGIQLIWGKLRSMWSLRPLRSMRFQRLEAEFRKTRNWIDHVSREVDRRTVMIKERSLAMMMLVMMMVRLEQETWNKKTAFCRKTNSILKFRDFQNELLGWMQG